MTSVEISTAVAFTFLGVPYVWGGDSRRGVDCSGLAQIILSASGRDPSGDQTAQGLHDFFAQSKITTPCEGALAFFGKDARHVTHVGYCVSDDRMIEAAGGGRECTSPEIAIKKGACVQLSPIARRSDCVGFAYPFLHTK